MKDRILNILKFILALLLVPVTIIATIQFTKWLHLIPSEYSHWFWVGLATYLIIHLFIFEPQIVYQHGQKLISGLFGFSAVLSEGAGRGISFYTLLSLIFLGLTHFIHRLAPFKIYAFFAVSFFLCMHMVFTARHLTEEDQSAVKPQYFLATELIYLINLVLLAGVFNLVFDKFSFVGLVQEFAKSTSHFYISLYRQLFIP